MNWNQHRLPQDHALLSASKYHWLNYDDRAMVEALRRAEAAARGTRRHAFAAQAIRLGIRLPKNGQTLNRYVNDAIGFHMTPEQVLYYSPNAFGTADAISFRRGQLRVHDLKTGVTKASINQLMVYAALFFMEYEVLPARTRTELRIYQNDDVEALVPDPADIIHVMDRIKHLDQVINQAREEV